MTRHLAEAGAMRIRELKINAPFKRFYQLTIEDIPEEARLVVLVGPNGSGKSSIFDAILHWAHRSGRKLDKQTPEYFQRPGQTSNAQVTADLHGELPNQPGKQVHVRSAYRYTPSIKTQGISKQPTLMERPAVYRMMDPDETGQRHYQTLVGRYVELLSDLTQERELKDVRTSMKPLEEAVERLFPGLSLAGLGSPLEAGSFYFSKTGQEAAYHYDVLSSGEKAAFDLLLDLFVTAQSVPEGLICLDEPESHLNPRVQADLVDEMLRLVPPTAQVWVATHSVGFLRRAMELHRSAPKEIVFLDLEDVATDEHVVLSPQAVTRSFWQSALSTALDDLAELIAPRIVVLCEGAPGSSGSSDANVSWDARVLSSVFEDGRPDVAFVSVGGKGDLEAAAESFATALSQGTRLLRLRDRDRLTQERRTELLSQDPNLRILARSSLENYLLDDEILENLVSVYGSRVSDGVGELKRARDGALAASSREGNAKPALGVVYETAKRVLRNNGQLGENRHQFSRDILAPLVKGSVAARELEEVLRLDE